MKRRLFFGLNLLGWMMIFIVLLSGAVYSVAADDELYFRLQSEAEILDSAGISEENLREIDARLSGYLFAPMNEDMALDNREIAVFGQMQPPFNERELEHLHDCRKLLSLTAPGVLQVLLLCAGGVLVLLGGRNHGRVRCRSMWIAAALVLLSIAALGIWAAVDFSGAFTFFHRILFTNDLWLLDPATDLLIRICPQSMFVSMGLRIGLRAVGVLLGAVLLGTLIVRLMKRKKEQNEVADL